MILAKRHFTETMRDEDFYGLAAREILESKQNVGLMAKAYALALGEAEKTKALYIGMRADQLKEEYLVNERTARLQMRVQKLAEEEERAKRAQQAKAQKAARKKDEEIARRKIEAIEAQKAGDAWNASSSYRDDWPKTNITSQCIAEETQKDSPLPQREELMSMEELDKLVDSLKTAAKKLGYS